MLSMLCIALLTVSATADVQSMGFPDGEQLLQSGLPDSEISITNALSGGKRKLLLGDLFSNPGGFFEGILDTGANSLVNAGTKQAVLGAESSVFGRRKLSQLLSASADSLLTSLTGNRKLLMGSAAATAEHGTLEGFEKVFTTGTDYLTGQIQGFFAPPGAGKRRLLQISSLFSGDIGGFFSGLGVDAAQQAFATGGEELSKGFGSLLNGR